MIYAKPLDVCRILAPEIIFNFSHIQYTILAGQKASHETKEIGHRSLITDARNVDSIP